MNDVAGNEQATQEAVTLMDQAFEIWMSGGWAMYAIAAVALLMFGWGTHVYLKLLNKTYITPEKTWRKWIKSPAKRKGPLGELLTFVLGGKTIEDTAMFFQELHFSEVAPFERDLKVMKMCVTAAPLLGLLGTVTGMLATFAALSSGAGGDKTMEMVASGISEALVTTETGLVVAIPGLFLQFHLRRMLDKYKAFLVHLETVCTQEQHREDHHTRYVQIAGMMDDLQQT